MTAIETRELKLDDWRLWRKLRQSALAEAPEAFGSTLVDWAGARTQSNGGWRGCGMCR